MTRLEGNCSLGPIKSRDLFDEQEPERPALPEYEPPRVVSYRGDELLEALGPMQACSFSGAVLVCGPEARP